MKLRTRLVLFFSILTVVLIGGLVFNLENYLGN
ncbi:MAG: hypothetical protein DDT18_01530 [Actinobacteria bacterium]|nr:hypothetical protein [Actinomycetota bacterium]